MTRIPPISVAILLWFAAPAFAEPQAELKDGFSDRTAPLRRAMGPADPEWHENERNTNQNAATIGNTLAEPFFDVTVEGY